MAFNVTKERQASPGRHGGKRPGAGRKPASQTHGKLTGAILNRQNNGDVTHRRRQLQDLIIGSDRDPLVVLIDLATDKSQDANLRVEAAGIACRYVHPTLAQAQISMLHQKADPTSTWAIINSRLDRLAIPDAANATPRARLQAVQAEPDHGGQELDAAQQPLEAEEAA